MFRHCFKDHALAADKIKWSKVQIESALQMIYSAAYQNPHTYCNPVAKVFYLKLKFLWETLHLSNSTWKSLCDFKGPTEKTGHYNCTNPILPGTSCQMLGPPSPFSVLPSQPCLSSSKLLLDPNPFKQFAKNSPTLNWMQSRRNQGANGGICPSPPQWLDLLLLVCLLSLSQFETEKFYQPKKQTLDWQQFPLQVSIKSLNIKHFLFVVCS